MKWMFFILGVYFLGLSCLPCTDNARQTAAQSETTISSIKTDQQGNHPMEGCTPLCSCACCATTICFMTTTKTQPPRLEFTSEKNTYYHATFTTGVAHSVWQPPRLS